jgi:hypothetical protein
LQNNLGYSYVNSGNANNEHEQAAAVAFNLAIAMNNQLQAAYYNRAMLHVNDLAKYSRAEPRSPFEDLKMAIQLGQGSGRDTGRLYYNAARIHGTAVRVVETRAVREFAGGSNAAAMGPFASIGGLINKAGLFLAAQDDADFHRKTVVEYARRALERGFDCDMVTTDPKIKPFLDPKEIGKPQLTVAVADINLGLVDLVPDFGK